MKRTVLVPLFLLLFLTKSMLFAGEGMWIPALLKQLNEKDRKEKIAENSEKVVKAIETSTSYQAKVKSFFKGNEYYVIVTKTFRDIRLVGAPPSNIGKFGGDTDNWMWPRHTGDFSLFRIYVGPDGKPAPYSENNVPYNPKYYFPISLKGVHNGDFTFVYGYPARTNEYLPSEAVRLIAEKENPDKIKLREARINIFKKYAKQSPALRIKYAAKEARVANYWKKMIGQSRGIRRMNGIEKKQVFEDRFMGWVNQSEKRQEKYGQLLPAFAATYTALEPYQKSEDYLREGGMGIELVVFASRFNHLVEVSNKNNSDTALINKTVNSLRRSSDNFFKDYYKLADKEVMSTLLHIYDKNVAFPYKPAFFHTIHKKFHSDYTAYTDYVFKKSFYPDANFTLRVTYGHVKGYSPADAIEYLPYTTLQGIMEKENPAIYDYVVEKRLKELYKAKDFGQYVDADGTLHVGFIADNHTSGGNSGSPVLDADGNLVGVNFDRCWEGTMSDLMFDPTVCRNISLDIRYFLFILDKYAGAGYLLKEMKLEK